MPSTYSTLLGVQLPATSEQEGVWGNSTNINFGKIIEQAIAGATVLDVTSSGGSYTLNDVDGTPSQSRSAILRFTGTPGATTTITVPTKSKVYTVRNDTDADIVLKTSAQVTGVTLGVNEATMLFCDGADMQKGIYQIIPAILPVSGGGTGVATFTAGIVKSPGGTTPLITESTVNMATTEVGSYLPVTRGGTGIITATTGSIVYSAGAAFGNFVGTASGDYIVSNGTNWTAGTTSLGGVESFNGRTGAISPVVGDYNSYYVLLNGSNASGTWSIDISGSCNYASTASNATSVTSITGSSSNGYENRSVSTGSSGSYMHYQYQ